MTTTPTRMAKEVAEQPEAVRRTLAHLLPAQEGWEQIADHVLAWAQRHAGAPRQAAGQQ